MNILLDTHIAVWAVLDHPKLTDKARKIILDPQNVIWYSAISTWEVFLKHKKRPELFEITSEEFVEYCQRTGFHPLGLSDKHVIAANSLDKPENSPEHNDPFDKLLISQAKSENFFFLTCDSKIAFYNEDCIIMG